MAFLVVGFRVMTNLNPTTRNRAEAVALHLGVRLVRLVGRSLTTEWLHGCRRHDGCLVHSSP